MSSEISTARLLIRSILGIGIFCALIFGGAGTFSWPAAWLYIIIQSSASAVMVLWLRKRNPALLKVRTEFWKRVTKPWDKAIMILFVAVSVPFFVLPGLDTIRYEWTHVPPLLQALGFVGILVVLSGYSSHLLCSFG